MNASIRVAIAVIDSACLCVFGSVVALSMSAALEKDGAERRAKIVSDDAE